MKNTLIAVAALAACASASAETISLKSPDGRNEITLATEPALTVSVARDGKPVLGPAPISMTFDGKGVIGGATVARRVKVFSESVAQRRSAFSVGLSL